MTKKGYTLVEVMLAMSMSLMILLAVHLIPARIMQSYGGYKEEVRINQTSHTLSSAIQTDLKHDIIIEDTDDGFKIGETTYVVNDDGVTRHIGTQRQQLTTKRVSYSINEGWLTIQSPEHEHYNARIDLVFSLVNNSFVSEDVPDE